LGETESSSKGFFISLPFAKIDREKREVWGVGTSEMLDLQGERVSYDASKAAFNEWAATMNEATQGKSMGNVREMHQPKAVGRLISVVPDDERRRVWVGAKLSASQDGQDAWKKIQEGVLNGFSIGAPTAKREIKFSKAGDPETWVTGFKLSEISLVDNPACPEAFFSEVKMCKGMLDPIEADAPTGEDVIRKNEKEEKQNMSDLEKSGKVIGVHQAGGTPAGAQSPQTPSIASPDAAPAPAKAADGNEGTPGGVQDKASKPISAPAMQGKAAALDTITEPAAEAAAEHAEMGKPPPVNEEIEEEKACKCDKCGQSMVTPPKASIPKAAAVDSEGLKKAFESNIEGLQKAVFAKVASLEATVGTLEKRLKIVEDTPASGGPVRTELPPGIVPVSKGGASAAATEDSQMMALEKAAGIIADPFARDAVQRQAATLAMKKALRS
jgi:hypothetical protein